MVTMTYNLGEKCPSNLYVAREGTFRHGFWISLQTPYIRPPFQAKCAESVHSPQQSGSYRRGTRIASAQPSFPWLSTGILKFIGLKLG